MDQHVEKGSIGDRGAASPPLRWALVGLSLSMLSSSVAASIANVALPALAGAFDASFQEVQWVVLAYLVAVTSLVAGVGKLGDALGRKRLLLAGILLFAGASVLCAMAPVLWVLIAARAVQGLAAAIMMALTMALVAGAVPAEKTGSSMGLLGTMSAAGTAVGPALGGALIAGAGWRAVFLVSLPMAILAFLLVLRFLPADRPRRAALAKDFDSAGALVLTLTIAAYALAMTLGRGSFGPVNFALLVAAAAGACIFLMVEMRATSPLVGVAMLADRGLRSGLAMSALVSTVMMATLVVGPFYLSGALGLDAARVGLLLSVGPLVAALAGFPAGRVVDRFGARPVTGAGLAGVALGALALSLLPPSSGMAGYVGPIALITLGYAMFQAANNTAVMAGVSSADRGAVSGLLNLSRNLGLVTGASAMGAVFALAAAAPASAGPEAIASGMRTTFAVAAILASAALAIAVLPRPTLLPLGERGLGAASLPSGLRLRPNKEPDVRG